MIPAPKRRHPAHPPQIILSDRSTIIFATMCVEGRRPLLANLVAHQLLVNTWFAVNGWRVGRYVIMPDHIHFFCAPFDQTVPLGKWMSYWRNSFTRSWPYPGDKPIWQRDYWDTQLRRGESYSQKWEYVRQNPVRKGLVLRAADWPYQGKIEELGWHEI